MLLYRVLHRGRLKGPSVLRGNSHGAFLGEAMTIIALPDNMIRKGQVEGGKGDVLAQNCVMAQVCGLIA